VLLAEGFQQCVSLNKCFVVLDQVIQVKFIKLADDTVNVFPAQFAAIVDQVAIVRRDHHQGKITDMVGKPFILFFIDKEPLPLVLLLNALDQFRCIVVALIVSVDGKEIVAMPDVLGIEACKTAFAEGKVMYGIEEVGLPNAVVAHKTVDLAGEDEFCLFIVFKTGEEEFLQVHLSC
jgi:hypothetical protein